MNGIKLTALALAIGAIGIVGYSYAKADDTSPPKPFKNAVEAGVIDQTTADKLRNYNNQQRQQRAQERLDSAVANGTITENEAQQIRDWQNNRPEAMDKIGGFGKGGMRGMGYGGDCPMAASDSE